jgi:hypothetical protein
MPKFEKLLTMNRQGEFSIFTTGDSHCGTMTDQFLPVKYHMVCECENVLDERGFLFEQVNVDKFFKGLQSTKLSCELLTISCCNKLVELIRKDNPACKVRSIKLTLSPSPFQASMTYSVLPLKEKAKSKAAPKRKQTRSKSKVDSRIEKAAASDPAFVAW